MDRQSGSGARGTLPDQPIDEIRRIFERAVALDAGRREQWLLDNVPDAELRRIVLRLVVADGQPGVLDVSVLDLLDATGFPDPRA